MNTNGITRTRLVMGRKVCSVLTVCFVSVAALHLDAVLQKELVVYSLRSFTWEKARLHCQKHNVDLVTMHALNAEIPWRIRHPVDTLRPLWMGLVRRSEDARVWTEVSFK